jgi:hypothetical protein
MSGLILGDWTHRRGDAGGSRAVSARILKPKPKIAWRWDLTFDGRIEQVRIVGDVVTIAATPAISHPGWQHAEVVTLEAATGRPIAQRWLPDPVPPSALVVDESAVRIVATRASEPVFLYTLEPKTLEPVARERLDAGDAAAVDIVDAWGHGADMWCQIETPSRAARLFAHKTDPRPALVWLPIDVGVIREPCLADGALFVPLTGTDETFRCVRIRAGNVTPIGEAASVRERTIAATLAADGAVYVVTAEPIHLEARTYEVALRVFDRETLLQRGETRSLEFFAPGAERLRLLRRPSGELVAQLLDAQMVARSDLFVADDHEVLRLALGNRPYVADLALGDQLVAHRELEHGRTIIAGFELDRRMHILGRRASLRWSLETPPVGSPVALYAGAGHILVRGSRALVAVAV